MSGGSTNTVSQETVPSWLQPYLTASLSQGSTALQNPPQYYPGQQVASLTPLQQQGISSVAGAAGVPSASSGAQGANEFMTSGALLNPSENPYLQQEFSLGAGQIQNNIESQFAGSGSNVSNSIPIQQQGMSDLASQLYGNAYGQGLTAMNQASALAPSIDQGTYLPGQALLSAGSTQQSQAQNQINALMQQWNYNQQLPENMLSWYTGLTGQAASPFMGSNSAGTQSANPGTMAAGGLLGAAGLYGLLGGGLGTAAAGDATVSGLGDAAVLAGLL